jgi:hypothetical protein
MWWNWTNTKRRLLVLRFQSKESSAAPSPVLTELQIRHFSQGPRLYDGDAAFTDPLDI